MTLVAADLILVEPATLAVDFSTEDVGGAKTTNEVDDSSVGGMFFQMPSTEDGSGDGDRVQYAKLFGANNSLGTNLENAKIWGTTFMADWPAGNDTAKGVSASEDDDATKCLRFTGYDTSGDPVNLDVALDGTTEVPTLDQLSYLARVTVHVNDSGKAPTTAAGPITISTGSDEVLGVIGAGKKGITAEVDISFSATLNDTLTIADAGTEPAGASWVRPRAEPASPNVANGGILTAEAAQGIWLRLTVKEGIKPSKDVPVYFMIDGDEAP